MGESDLVLRKSSVVFFVGSNIEKEFITSLMTTYFLFLNNKEKNVFFGIAMKMLSADRLYEVNKLLTGWAWVSTLK